MELALLELDGAQLTVKVFPLFLASHAHKTEL